MKRHFLDFREYIDRNNRAFLVFIFALCSLNFGFLSLVAHFSHYGDIARATCQWDCRWYTGIVHNGYDRLPRLQGSDGLTQADWAFFPLYPLVSYAMQVGLHISTLWAELSVNLILWPVLIYLCWRELAARAINVDRIGFALFCVLYPFNIWYTSQYSEGVYGVLLISTLILLRKNHILWAALACFLLGFSRPTGFPTGVMIAGWWFFRRTGITLRTRSIVRGRLAVPAQESFLLISAAGAGLSVFVLYLYNLMGDGFAFSHVEVGWEKHFSFFLTNFIDSFLQAKKIKLGIYFIFSCYFIYGMLLKKWYLNFAIMAFIALMVGSTGLESIERYVFSNPLMIEFLAFLTLTQARVRRWSILTLLLVLHIVVIELWFHGHIALI
ncbi:hypothetical protein KOEU_20080 [Komagataeibacter europaeus]|uniref:Mannosyltransferase (PIG-V) n=2 Tax=Komagataeibacter europaeus TaxID=33995 RepID=A0A0M0EGM6_KOMEU|nr:hypothetical protein [Komagataeibacter europaeus]KON64424.1 hypothetical protein KOEU_20080 [Komagataeibacter europaeus]